MLLLLVPGQLFASTALLPSSYTTYCLTAAAAYVMQGRPLRVVVVAVLGILWGWPVAGGPELPLLLPAKCLFLGAAV